VVEGTTPALSQKGWLAGAAAVRNMQG